MTVAQPIVRDAGIGIAIAEKPADLNAFFEPHCAAAIWRRQSSPGFQEWINNVDPANLPHGRITLHHQDVRRAVTSFCDLADTPVCAQRERLVDDVATLSSTFADLMNATYLRLRLAVVTTNACRKFHIDAITARLICTYRGLGTQYGISHADLDPSRIFIMPTGAPILLRGTGWPEHPSVGLLHRSPPIIGTGETRLVLVLDPVFDPEGAA